MRDEIREGAIKALLVENRCENHSDCEKKYPTCAHCDVDIIWDYLHSKGVVIKVDRELPELGMIIDKATVIGTEYDKGVIKGIHMAWGNYKAAGYTAVEPLIGDE